MKVKANNGVFYTPFGDKIGSVEEAEVWAGDSFDRGTSLSYCSADSAKSATISATNCCVDGKILNDLCGVATLSAAPLKGELCINTADVASSTKSITDDIKFLQKQIDVLRDEIRVKKDVAPLRAQLKTLNYTREVE
jgi:hypothetical protein